jgi:hypothetical protein
MVTAPDLDFISFNLPYTWRSVIKEEGHMDTTALQVPITELRHHIPHRHEHIQ